MNLRITSLASGSSGNAFLVETGAYTLLVEAGLAARTLERRVRECGVDPASLAAIIVSHEHNDHAQGAAPLARRFGIPVVASAGTAAVATAEWKGLDVRRLHSDGISVGDVTVWGVPLPHDAAEPQAIVLRYGNYSAAWALDLGHVPPYLAQALQYTDLLVVEANHDRELLLAAPYPWGIKHRIMSDRGHLSNLQASELIAAVCEDHHPRTVWLAHLSERANDHPRGVLRFVNNYLDMTGVIDVKLEVAERNRPSAVWAPQLTLFDWQIEL